ncbi:MAG: flagellar hook-associated protein FlgK [Hydrogenovibrio sp.]|nr:flagellar hook-associated protein FlgK [Hydrogenovibrio sp.]
MADLLTIGSNATNTFQRAIQVTSNNVANVSTDGYTRQRADITSNYAGYLGGLMTGGGSSVSSVQRVYADYIQNQLVTANSLKSRYDEQLSLSKQVEGVVSSNDGGVQTYLQNLFDAFQGAANNPTSTASRQQVIDQSTNLQTMLGNMSTVLTDTQNQTNKQISSLTDEINNRLDSIYQLNKEVAKTQTNGGQPPNELLDQRDQAIMELSKFVDIKTFPQDDGQVSIYTGNGKFPMLTGNTVTHLQAARSEFTNENRTEIYMDVGGERKMVSDQFQHGQLGAVLDFRTNMLDKSMDQLGVTLNGLVAGTNWQHYQGYDINGDAGQNVFKPLNMNALASSNNTGPEDGSNIAVNFTPAITAMAGYNGQPPYTPATQPATYGDKEAILNKANSTIGDFQAREYEVRVNAAGNYDVYDRNSASSTPLATVPFGTAAEIDGLNFDFTSVAAGTVSTGDKFLLKPHQQILSDFQSVLTDPDKLATRGQSPNDTNANNNLLDELPSPAAIGDNVNMANMANLADKKLLYSDASGNPSMTILDGYSKMSSSVGGYVQGTQTQLTAQENVFKQISDRRESMSGVSLDEEAANLVKYQQAYQASAQIIQTSQSLFQTLIGSMR